MKVLLLQDVQGVGKKGESIDVKIGHANNYLLPKNLARVLTVQAEKELSQKLEREHKKEGQTKKALVKIADKLSGKRFSITAKANDQGTLFSAISEKDVMKHLQKTMGIEFPQGARAIFVKPIKHTGEFQARVRIAPEVETSIILNVIS